MFRLIAVCLLLVTFGCTGDDSSNSSSTEPDVDPADAEPASDIEPDSDAEPSDDTVDTANDDSGRPGDDVGGGDADAGGLYDCQNPHPDWLFCEDFESGGGDYDTWFDQSGFVTAVGGDDRGRIDLSDEHKTSGDWSVYMPASEQSGYRGADLVWYACDGAQETNCDLRGYDQLYFRTWVRFAPDHRYVHHFLNIRGLDRFWAYGSAGCLPNGESSMGTTVDFDEDTHETFFYTYHLDMGCDTNCGNYLDVDARCDECEQKGFPTCDEQQQCCWGNHERPDDPVALPVDEWFCFEMMMEANTPGQSDGQMAYWINDDLAHQVDGFRWRTTAGLQLNRVGLQHYISSGSADQPNRVWFDDVVVSTERIGCQ